MYNLWHFKNNPTNYSPVKKWEENLNLINTTKIDSPIDLNQKVIISRKDFTLKIDWILNWINIWDKHFYWKYIVLEKWEYPFFKSENFFFYPWDDNPLKKHLIILWDLKTWKVIKQWIHRYIWVTINNPGNFKVWYTEWKWCVRLNPLNIEEIFNNIKLWAKIIID
jgi:hypothetical protein